MDDQHCQTNSTGTETEAQQEGEIDKESTALVRAPDEIKSFDDLQLSEELLRGIFAYGFEKPSTIQQRAIRPIIAGRDLIAQGRSGSGKTAAFTIGALAKLKPTIPQCQVLILGPTREIVQQTYSVLQCLSDYMNIVAHACVGGSSVRRDIRILQKGAQVVVGTTGRVADMISRRVLRVNKMRLFILDEADDMLSSGRISKVYNIFKYLPKSIQVCIFSTTMPSDALHVTRRFMRNPLRILLRNDELMLDKVKQFYSLVDSDENKVKVLCDLIESLDTQVVLIYCRDNQTVDRLWHNDQLTDRVIMVSIMHGDMDSREREMIFRDFRNGNSSLLVTTDIMARGIDVPQVSIVINFDMPTKRETYIHRIGRTGRFGRKGVVVNFLKKKELVFLRETEELFNTKVDEISVPINVVELVDK